MATRLYLGRASFSAIDPGVLGTWGNSYRQIYKMGTTKENTTFTTYTITNMTTSGSTLMRQFITAPMVAGTAFDSSSTWKFVCRYKESSTALNIFPKIYGSFVSSLGVPRGYTFSYIGGTEFATSLTAREISFTGLIGTYTTQTGDRLVLEVGWQKDASTSGDASISLGDNAVSDLTGSGDTGIDNPWFEMSEDVTFSAEGSGATAGDKYSLTTYISAVLDEWV